MPESSTHDPLTGPPSVRALVSAFVFPQFDMRSLQIKPGITFRDSKTVVLVCVGRRQVRSQNRQLLAMDALKALPFGFEALAECTVHKLILLPRCAYQHRHNIKKRIDC
jgi:hypothetical protein